MISLTALVMTYNEQENIRRNLEALVWVPRVLIVDSLVLIARSRLHGRQRAC
jgi:hypothetical protein